MLLVPTTAALIGAVLPYTGLAHLLGFTPLPWTFFLLLMGMVIVYLLLVELAKTRFYRTPTRCGRRHPPPTPSDSSGASCAGRPASATTRSATGVPDPARHRART